MIEVQRLFAERSRSGIMFFARDYAERYMSSPMAKKVRQPRSSSPRTYSQAGLQSTQQSPTQNQAPTSPRQAAPAAATAARAAAPVDLAVEYNYVGKELRRLGITAAVLIALEILLGLVVR
jgi:hypothetical protein